MRHVWLSLADRFHCFAIMNSYNFKTNSLESELSDQKSSTCECLQKRLVYEVSLSTAGYSRRGNITRHGCMRIKMMCRYESFHFTIMPKASI